MAAMLSISRLTNLRKKVLSYFFLPPLVLFLYPVASGAQTGTSRADRTAPLPFWLALRFMTQRREPSALLAQ